MEHALSEPVRAPHPGGKNNWWKVDCSCGYSAWEAIKERAIKRAETHKTAKESS